MSLTPAEGTDFPYTERPKSVNNMFILFLFFFFLFCFFVFLVFKMIGANCSANSLSSLRRTITL